MHNTPIDIFASALCFYEDGLVRAEKRRTAEDSGGWQIATFHVESDEQVHADHWEVHPEAEEAVCVLSGGVRLYLRPERAGDDEEMVRLTPGTAFIVPRGRWHRLELDAPTDLMSVTLRRGSRLERRTGM